MNDAKDTEMLRKELEQAVCSEPLNRELILDLIQRGADPNFQKDEESDSFFSELLGFREPPISIEAVELLIEAGADPNHDPGNGMRPLANAYWSYRRDLVELLLRHGAEPNFIVEENESLLDMAECSYWIDKEQIGTAWQKDYHQSDVEKQGQIVDILKAAGAKSMQEMVAAELVAWVHLWPGASEKMITGEGYIPLDKIPGLTDEWKKKWLEWCARNFNPGNDGSILDAPAGFDRRAYNQEGLELAREFKTLAGGRVRVDLFLLDPDDEEAFVRNAYIIRDVGGEEKRPTLASPFCNYAKDPGFHIETKAAVAADLSDVKVLCEFFVRGERYRSELKLNYWELERSIEGDGRYAIFSQEGNEVMVDVLWGKDTVLWRVELPSGADELVFKREKYAEVIQNTKRWGYHTDRRARIAIERFKNRVPTLTNTGQIQLPAESAARALPNGSAGYVPTGQEAELARRSRIWEACVFFAAAVNLRSTEILADRLAERACITGDKRPNISGKQAVLDYLHVAFHELLERTEEKRVWAEVGHFWLTGEACVLLWEGGRAVALGNVHRDSEGEYTGCHFITEPELVQSVKGLKVYPGLGASAI